MAKTTGTGERGRIKVRVIEMEVDGGDNSLHEALRSLSVALAPPTPRAAPKLPGAGVDAKRIGSGSTNGNTGRPGGSEILDHAQQDEEDGGEPESPTVSPDLGTSRSRAGKPRSVRPPKPIDSLDMNTPEPA